MGPAAAESVRVATFNAEMARRGPGLFLRDLTRGKDPQIAAVMAVIAGAAPDILLLNGIDHDRDLVALNAFAEQLRVAGADYPFLFALRPNTGLATGLDLDGDGQRGDARDAQGFGRFAGEGGMAVLSRLPIDAAAAQDYSAYLWRDLPGTLITGAALSPEAEVVQRLSTTGHWAVPVILPDGARLVLLAWHATPPVFDGSEDRNGRRNHDETAFWLRLLDGALPWPAPEPPFVILGDANLDPVDGEGRRDAIRALLADPRVRDLVPESAGGIAAAAQGGPNATQSGDPARDTADWPETGGPGNMRVDYVLPSAGLRVTGSGIWWPEAGAGAETAALASRHRLVWADIALP